MSYESPEASQLPFLNMEELDSFPDIAGFGSIHHHDSQPNGDDWSEQELEASGESHYPLF